MPAPIRFTMPFPTTAPTEGTDEMEPTNEDLILAAHVRSIAEGWLDEETEHMSGRAFEDFRKKHRAEYMRDAYQELVKIAKIMRTPHPKDESSAEAGKT